MKRRKTRRRKIWWTPLRWCGTSVRRQSTASTPGRNWRTANLGSAPSPKPERTALRSFLTSSMRGTTVWLTKSSILSSKVPPAPCTTGGSSRSDIDNYHLTEIPGFKGFL
ncbi:hypothetical protein J4Q44_G00097010 [Coregonus suidteri]|uniref:Uncharacterized protein n=1 Tax=Coregonus suidteri TaxID=861788 RepID=A0AAN8M1V5_9TELE